MGDRIAARRQAEVAAISHSVQRLNECFGGPADAVITLGSGLGPVLERAERIDSIPTVELGFPASTVAGHAGEAVLTQFGDSRVLFISGRVHYYEGYSMDEVVRYVRAVWKWGARRLVLTCSAGSVHAGLVPGTITRMVDHINYMGDNPLIGGPLFDDEARFPDGGQAHDLTLHRALAEAAVACGLDLPEAVYAALSGPAYESGAEVRMLRTMGADLAGMSTVPELLAAKAIGLPAIALAVVSNFGAGVGEGEVDHDSVTAVAGEAAVKLAEVLEKALAVVR